MAFFSKNKTSENKEQAPKRSVRDLYARASEKWFAEGNAESQQRRGSSFEGQRDARRASAGTEVLIMHS